MEHAIKHKIFNTDKAIYGLAAFAVLVKLVLLPMAQTIDADAVTRTFLSEGWIHNPVWITKGVWGPFHFYLVGCMLALWNNMVYAPVVLNVILSAVTLLPFYYLVKREFNANGALIATYFFAISPIIFRNSLMNMSEPPYLLLLTITLNFLSKGFKDKNTSCFLFAGLFITIACGFRFEAWFFILLFTFVILLKGEIKNAFFFFIIAILYPVGDVITHFVQDHYSLAGFFTNYPWSLRPDGDIMPPHFEDYLRRLWYVPFCWFIALGPPVAYLAMKKMASVYKKNAPLFWLAFLFWAFLILTEVSSFKGAIILQPRFSETITLLSLPFSAAYFKELTIKKIRLAILFGALAVGLTYVYNISRISPLPRLENQNTDKISQTIRKELNPQSGLIIDFLDWEPTYYIALHSTLAPENIYILSGDDKTKIQAEEINSILQNHSQGIIFLVKNSVLWQNAGIMDKSLQFKFNTMNLNTQIIYGNDEVVVWKYSE